MGGCSETGRTGQLRERKEPVRIKAFFDPRRWGWKKRSFFSILLLSGIGYIFILPDPLFNNPSSTILLDRNGELLGARISDDGQWRFPPQDSVPKRFAKALIRFEDKRFRSHPGVDPLAIGRAAYQNIREGRIVSGGSTLSMQVIRMSRDHERTFPEKAIEAVMATRLEIAYSKEEILAKYASHAPFGGNVVGLDAAAWRYFGKAPGELGWGEAATLAVLPNDPSSIHPGRGRDALKKKRDRLLGMLQEDGLIDSTTCRLARMEQLPRSPQPLPREAPHLLSRVEREKKGERLRSSLDQKLQIRCNRIVEEEAKKLERNKIHNAAALVMENESREISAYVGNVRADSNEHERKVDMVRAERSSGSILKPFLYGSMLDAGELLPEQLLPDIPLRINGFSPENFDDAFRGAVPADKALARSLNVPAVHLLQEYGVGRFLEKLRDIGFTTMEESADHYGLSLILGGSETELEELVANYGKMGRKLKRANRGRSKNPKLNTPDIRYELGTEEGRDSKKDFPLGSGTIWSTLQAMEEARRPGIESGWEQFTGSRRIAYKTGTSYGHRDAWAVAVTPEHTVGVWAGNSNGKGRKGLTGVRSAAPILFRILRALDVEDRFKEPMRDLQERMLCSKSGHPASRHCPEVDTLAVPDVALSVNSCPYHERIHLSKDHRYRVHAECLSASERKSEERFILPPVQEYFYRRENPSYGRVPPLAPYCQGSGDVEEMALIHPPTPNSVHYLPVGFSGEKSELVFEAAHRQSEETLHWHLNDRYLGSTEKPHQMAFEVEKGEHLMRVVDGSGNALHHPFEILGREEAVNSKQ